MKRDLSLTLFRAFLVLAFFAITLPVPFVVTRPQDLILMALGIIALSIVSAPAFLWKDFRVFEPLTLVILMVFFCVSFKLSYVVAFVNERPYVNNRLLLGRTPQVLEFGTVVLIVGLVFFMLGYWRRVHRWGFDRLVPFRFSTWNARRLLIMSVAMTIVAAVSFGMFVRSTGAEVQSLEDLSQKRFTEEEVGSSQRIFSASYLYYRVAALAKFPFYLMLAWMIRQQKPLLSLEAVIVAVAGAQSIALSFFMNSRAGVVLLLLDAVVITYFLQRRVDLRKVVLLGCGVVIVLLTQLAVRNRSGQELLDTVEYTIAGRDLMDVSKTAHIINAVSYEIDYRYGETLVGWIAAPIPASVWPNKPMWSELFNYLMVYVYGDESGFTGIPPGLVAELYWNMGWFGVCVGMLLIGSMLRLLYDTFLPHLNSVSAVVIYTLLSTRLTLFTLGSDLGTGLLKAALDVLPMVGLIWLVREVKR